MSDLFLRPLFTWRSAVASPFGPESPTTRLVLLTLSLYMSELGDSCFPSQETLALRSGLALRSVKEHLTIAAHDGWVGKRERRQSNGQDWRGTEYFAVVPPGVEVKVLEWERERRERYQRFHGEQRGAPAAPAIRGAPPAPPASEISEGGASDDKGGAPERTNVVQQVHPSTSRSTSKKESAAAGGGKRPLPVDFSISDGVRTWAEKQGWGVYLQAHFEFFVDWAKGGGHRKTDWDATFRNCVRTDWGGVRKAMIARGIRNKAETDTRCTENVAGEACGMAGELFGDRYLCGHHRAKRMEPGQMPDSVRTALSKFKQRRAAP